jgi:tetratricopeptide (TPR) repeat protein
MRTPATATPSPSPTATPAATVTTGRCFNYKHHHSNRIKAVSSFLILLLTTATTTFTFTHAFSTPNPNNNNKKQLTSSQKFRREEDQRRLSRINENIPGKTSAIPGAKDYPINIQQTQNEWMAQASTSDRQVREYTQRGMDLFKLLKLEEANEAFDTLYQLKPNAYCWQAGVVKFYLGDYYNAAKLFVHNANIYETRFGGIASEERIWRDACELKIMNTVIKTSKHSKLKKNDRILKAGGTIGQDGNTALPVAQMMTSNTDTTSAFGAVETRKVIRLARDLFSSSVDYNLSNEALARGKLRSICGEYDTKIDSNTNNNNNNNNQNNNNNMQSSLKTDSDTRSFASPNGRGDKKMWRLSSWYYLGLHYDVLDDVETSRDCMKMALRQCASSGNADDIVQILPLLHMARRDWFDDEEFSEDEGDFDFDFDNMDGQEDDMSSWSSNTSSGSSGSNNSMHMHTYANDNLFQSIQDSVDKLKLYELKNSLKKKGLKSSGSKSILKDRLLRSLLDEAGLSP